MSSKTLYDSQVNLLVVSVPAYALELQPIISFNTDILPKVQRHYSEYLATFNRMFDDIHWDVCRYSPECLRTFPKMFGDIPRNVLWHSPEYNIPLPLRSPHSVSRSYIPGFIHSRSRMVFEALCEIFEDFTLLLLTS